MRRARWALLALLALPGFAWACPTCKDVLVDNPGALGFAKGVYVTVLLMLSMVFGLAGFFIYKIIRLAKAESEGSVASQPKA